MATLFRSSLSQKKSERTIKRASYGEEETIEALLSKADSNSGSENETKAIPLGTNSCNSDNEIPPGFSPLTSLGVRAIEKAVILISSEIITEYFVSLVT
jgi:hypothetical protein